MSDWSQAPLPGEVEVCLFGPGKGECVLIHIGNSEWIVVDSCVDDLRQPAALAYLDSLGVDRENIRLIVASHWHDDHVGGLADLVRGASEARLVCSSALEPDEFLHLVSAADLRPMVRATSGVHEFRRVLDCLADRRTPPGYAAVDRVLYRRPQGIDITACEVVSLAPSDASAHEALQNLRQLLEAQSETQRRAVPRPRRNPAAVVLWLTVGTIHILLGSDLEVDSDSSKGWTAVLGAITRPNEVANFFKVAHHGSANAHDDRVWIEMLEPDVHAALTPYLSGSTPIPRPTDIERLLALTPNAWITRLPGTPRVKRDWRVDRMANDATRWIRAAEPQNAGVIRLRRLADGSDAWRVHASGSAQRLT